jgi:hypothetical protein
MLNNKFKIYLTLHTFENAIFYPYGYKHGEPANAKQLKKVANAGCQAAKTMNVAFTCNPINKLYIATGSIVDYALEVAQILLAYFYIK